MTDPVDFIPAGIQMTQANWYGKRPNAVPLTDTFIRTAVKGGSIVPPADDVVPGSWLRLGALIVIATCALTVWLVIYVLP
jgi:hypothetical protein